MKAFSGKRYKRTKLSLKMAVDLKNSQKSPCMAVSGSGSVSVSVSVKILLRLLFLFLLGKNPIRSCTSRTIVQQVGLALISYHFDDGHNWC